MAHLDDTSSLQVKVNMEARSYHLPLTVSLAFSLPLPPPCLIWPLLMLQATSQPPSAAIRQQCMLHPQLELLEPWERLSLATAANFHTCKLSLLRQKGHDAEKVTGPVIPEVVLPEGDTAAGPREEAHSTVRVRP